MNPWVILGIAVMWALSLLGVGKWQRADGRAAERVEWQERDNKELADANATIKRLNDEARATEEKRAADMNVIATNYAKGYENAEARRRRDVAAARDGALVLRIPASACGSGGGETGPPRPAAAGGDGAPAIELPRAVTADLFALADDADQVADQLRSCQQIAINDRKEITP